MAPVVVIGPPVRPVPAVTDVTVPRQSKIHRRAVPVDDKICPEIPLDPVQSEMEARAAGVLPVELIGAGMVQRKEKEFRNLIRVA